MSMKYQLVFYENDSWNIILLLKITYNIYYDMKYKTIYVILTKVKVAAAAADKTPIIDEEATENYDVMWIFQSMRMLLFFSPKTSQL